MNTRPPPETAMASSPSPSPPEFSRVSTPPSTPFSKIRRKLNFEDSPSSPNKISTFPGQITTSETPSVKKLLNSIDECWDQFISDKRKIQSTLEAMEAERARKIRMRYCLAYRIPIFLLLSLIPKVTCEEDQMAPRWKGKDVEAKNDAEVKALEEPMSKIICQLDSSLVQLDASGFLCDKSVFIEVGAEQTDLLCHACFGQFMNTVDNDKQGFQLGIKRSSRINEEILLQLSGVSKDVPV